MLIWFGFVCDRMILFWGRSLERGLLEWFIELHWPRSLHPRYYVFDSCYDNG